MYAFVVLQLEGELLEESSLWRYMQCLVPESLIDMCVCMKEPGELRLKPLFLDIQNVQYLQNLSIYPILT